MDEISYDKKCAASAKDTAFLKSKQEACVLYRRSVKFIFNFVVLNDKLYLYDEIW
jgi:hypothetical protein